MRLLKLLPAIGIIIFIYILSRINLSKIIYILSGIDVFLFSLSLSFILIVSLLKSLKISLSVKAVGKNLKLTHAFKIFFIGVGMGYLTPGRLGDFIRVAYIDKKIKNTSKSLISYLVDRISDVASLFILGIVGSVFLSYIIDVRATLSLLFLLFLAAILFLSKKKSAKFIFRPVFRFFIPKRFKSKLRASFDEIYECIGSVKKSSILPVFFLSLITWVVSITQGYVLALALNIKIPYVFFLLTGPISMLISMLPVSIAGLGTREATMIYIYSLVGVTPEEIVALSLLSLLINYIIFPLPSIVFMLRESDIKVVK